MISKIFKFPKMLENPQTVQSSLTFRLNHPGRCAPWM
nr:MAG TPA: hypothetical protein [Caudoviricetes sp.]